MLFFECASDVFEFIYTIYETRSYGYLDLLMING